MKNNELVWREIVDAAVTSQQRRWDNVDDLAFRAGVAPSTASYALRRLAEVGAIQRYHAGFATVNPGKVLTLLCAARSIVADTLAIATLNDADLQAVRSKAGRALIAGGPTAAVEILGGANTVSDYSQWVFYARGDDAAGAVSDMKNLHQQISHDSRRVTVTVLRADARAARKWRTHASFAQTYADLFATPGWQASEFRLALHDKFLGARDWDQE